MNKKRLVISYQNLSEELLEALKKKYPSGYGDAVMKINGPNDKVFYAVMLDMPEASYLVKVDVKIDSVGEEVDERSDFEEDEFSTSTEDSEAFESNEDDFDNIPESEE